MTDHAPFFQVTDITTRKIIWVKVDAVAAVGDYRVELIGGQTIHVAEEEDAIMERIEDQYVTGDDIWVLRREVKAVERVVEQPLAMRGTPVKQGK